MLYAGAKNLLGRRESGVEHVYSDDSHRSINVHILCTSEMPAQPILLHLDKNRDPCNKQVSAKALRELTRVVKVTQYELYVNKALL